MGIHFGHPVPVNRNHPDFYALMVANSYLGEHRTFHGRLMQELRGKRGLNYGDYSYIEYWDNAPGTSNPPPNHPRRQQAFSVWVRPVIPENALFALRAAVAEVERLRATGLTQSEFEITRDFLTRYSKLWARSLSDRLGFHMDSRFYAMPYFIDRIETELQRLTVEAVTRAAREYLRTDDFQAVIISDNALALRERLMKDEPSEVRYENPVTDEVTAADRAIRALKLRPADVRILPIESTFTGVEPPPGRGQAGHQPGDGPRSIELALLPSRGTTSPALLPASCAVIAVGESDDPRVCGRHGGPTTRVTAHYSTRTVAPRRARRSMYACAGPSTCVPAASRRVSRSRSCASLRAQSRSSLPRSRPVR
ncbi:MAG: insulinase family protein [Acidobacteria bacterium]|nr:insulinase family protein [Acidobacteriota bacterium]